MKSKPILSTAFLAATLVGCSAAQENNQGLLPDFGSAVRVYGEPHSVRQLEVIRCTKYLIWTVSKNDIGFQSLATHNGAPEVNKADYATMVQALNPLLVIASGEKIKSVDPSSCVINTPVDFNKSVETNLMPEITSTYSGRLMGEQALLIYGTAGQDSKAVTDSLHMARLLFIQQP
jgi:hypothetical protein